MHTTAQHRSKLEDRRQKLQAQIDTFLRRAERFIPIDNDDTPSGSDTPYIGDEWDSFDLEAPENPVVAREMAEHATEIPAIMDPLPLPSVLGLEMCHDLDILDLADQELQLRYGQANDALHHIRLALGYKSHLYRENIRKAKSKRKKLGAFDQVTAITNEVQSHARTYALARRAMIALNAPAEMLGRYQLLQRSDLTISTSIVDPQAHGLGKASSTSLSWIWTTNGTDDEEQSGWMSECILPFDLLHFDMIVDYLLPVYRVTWLRSVALRNRWREETMLVDSEMRWTVNYFTYHANRWSARTDACSGGHKCYAARQAAFWRSLAERASESFTKLSIVYPV